MRGAEIKIAVIERFGKSYRSAETDGWTVSSMTQAGAEATLTYSHHSATARKLLFPAEHYGAERLLNSVSTSGRIELRPVRPRAFFDGFTFG